MGTLKLQVSLHVFDSSFSVAQSKMSKKSEVRHAEGDACVCVCVHVRAYYKQLLLLSPLKLLADFGLEQFIK